MVASPLRTPTGAATRRASDPDEGGRLRTDVPGSIGRSRRSGGGAGDSVRTVGKLGLKRLALPLLNTKELSMCVTSAPAAKRRPALRGFGS